MASKIIFEIRLRLIWFLLIRAEVLIILILIWVDIVDILVIKIEIFYNMIWLSRIEWLWLIFSGSFVLTLIMMKVGFLPEVWIDWSWLWCSCCVSSDHQKLLWSWKLWLISWFINWLTSLIRLALSVAVIVLRRPFTRQKVDWHEIQLCVWYVCELIVEMLIEQKFEQLLSRFNFVREWKPEKHWFSIKLLIFHSLDKVILDSDRHKLRDMNSHLHINFLSCS